jgi:flagellar biosynthesis chaperone FliJ
MRPRTRLDPVIKLEESTEQRRLLELAEAGRVVSSAREALSGAEIAARTDHRRTSSALDWQLAELAHTRTLHEVRSAEHAVKSATEAAGASRALYAKAHSKAEALRRVADARAAEIVAQRQKADAREMDELSLLRFTGSGAAG